MRHCKRQRSTALSWVAWTLGASSSSVAGTRTNSTYQLTTREPWSSIGAANVSGRGFYTTSSSWSNDDGAFLDLGSLVNNATASINGRTLPPLDPTWARAEVATYLTQGENTVEVVISSTLGNAVAPLWSELRSGGTTPGAPAPGTDEYGLLGPAQIVPYKTTNSTL